MPAAPTLAKSEDGYWPDQYIPLLYVGLFGLAPEPCEMRRAGAGVAMVYADSLPDRFLRWILDIGLGDFDEVVRT